MNYKAPSHPSSGLSPIGLGLTFSGSPNGHVPDGLHIARVENLEKELLAFDSKIGCKAVNYFPNSVYQGPSRVVSDIDKNRKPAISKKAKISIASHYSSDFDLFRYNP